MAIRGYGKVKEIFNAALEKEPAKRRMFLDQKCGDDVKLRQEIESLLSSYEDANSFMETSIVGSPSEIHQLKNGQTFEHYKIIEQIGVGGMGKVYLAYDIGI